MFEYLSLHTKVRRLGYLKLLVEQYFDRDFLPVNSFNQYFEKVAADKSFQKQLDEYARYYRKDNKGIIEFLSTGASAEPYTKLAEDLSIIAKSNYSYILTKYGKVYKVIYERYKKERAKFRFIEELKVTKPMTLFEDEPTRSNLFVLNALDKFFFLKMILEKDFLYLKSILNIIGHKDDYSIKNRNVKYEIVKENLSRELLIQARAVHDSKQLSQNQKNKALQFEKKISSKDLQIRSYESIVEPRINWLLDLDLIDGSKHKQDSLVLTEQGESLLNKIKYIYDVENFIETEFVRTYCSVYKILPKSESIIEKRVEKYLNYAFINFKTLAPSRINASQAFNYISIMCLLRDGIVAEYTEIKKYIFTIDGKGYTIDWFPSENDGSIKISK
jgi:hypothetical protein